MKPTDQQLILYFILRPEMYIGQFSKEKVEAFLIGFETALRGNYKITSKISKWLTEKHGIRKGSFGWSKQLEQYSIQKGEDWLSSLITATLHVLLENVSNQFKQEIYNWIRKLVCSLVTNYSRINFKLWKIKWQGICHLDENWFLELWIPQELELLKKVHYLLNKSPINTRQLANTINKLKLLTKE